MQFKDKVALITGAARGIGKVIAESFAEQGARIVINDKEQNDIDKTVADFKAKKYLVMGVKADVGDIDKVLAMVQVIKNNFGRIDILINNAGLRKMGQDQTLEKILQEEWEAMLRTNIGGLRNTCQIIAPLMKEQRSGSIVNISSQAAIFVPYMTGLPYITSKGAVISFTKGLAKEMGRFNVRVNAILPGFIETENKKELLPRQDYFSKVLSENIALGRRGSPSEVANVCLFLCSDMASYITGEIIAVSGGMPSVLFL